MSPAPFHLSLTVPELRVAARFYVEVLGCTPGRDEEGWLDLLMYGHQLTLHQATPHQPAQAIDHFGVVLDEVRWRALAEQLEASGISFALSPQVVDAGLPHERGKFLLRDPAGNLLEFKYRVS